MKKKNRKTAAPYSSTKEEDKDEWGTPDWLFQFLNRRFRFKVDAFAAPGNALCKTYWTKEDSALDKDWHKVKGNIFFNPPYSRGNIESAVEIAGRVPSEYARVGLIKYDPSTHWFRHYCSPCEDRVVYPIPFRIKYKGADHVASFPSCIVVWNMFPRINYEFEEIVDVRRY